MKFTRTTARRQDSRDTVDQPDGAPRVRAAGVHKRYGSGDAAVHAVRGIDLELHQGEIVALVGPSGSGKSTLLHLLSGLDVPTAGSVWLNGRRLDELGEQELARVRARGMGFVLQRDNLIPSLTVVENVAMPLLMTGSRRRDALARAGELLDAVGIRHRGDAWPAEVSGGEAQRAAVARACVAEPLLIFADEPTGALDSDAGATVLGLFQEMAKKTRAATLLVTHDDAAAAIADRLIRMKDGRLVDQR